MTEIELQGAALGLRIQRRKGRRYEIWDTAQQKPVSVYQGSPPTIPPWCDAWTSRDDAHDALERVLKAKLGPILP